MADIFFPRVWLRRAVHTPVGTVSLTVYFHADEAMLARAGTDCLLAQARGQGYFKGFHDQTAQLWRQAEICWSPPTRRSTTKREARERTGVPRRL